MKLVHLAITMHGIRTWSEINNVSIDQAYRLSFEKLSNIIKFQKDQILPALSIHLLPEEWTKSKNFSVLCKELGYFLSNLLEDIKNGKVKVSVIGKWYDLPNDIVEKIKVIISETQDQDQFFLNLFINYNGNQEILDSCKILARKVKLDKLDVESMTLAMIKENLSSSYIFPPDLLIKNGNSTKGTDFFLWDSPNSKIFQTKKSFPDFSIEELLSIIDHEN